MTLKQQKISAISLALLVLISTTGISMNMMLCNCTGKQYLSVFASMMDLDCCKVKLQEVKVEKTSKHDCCTKKQTKSCNKEQKNSGKTTILAQKKCCKSNFKYAKANINLDVVSLQELPVSNLVLPLAYSFPTTFHLDFVAFPKTIALEGPPNKAPPRYNGQALMNWFQVYRC